MSKSDRIQIKQYLHFSGLSVDAESPSKSLELREMALGTAVGMTQATLKQAVEAELLFVNERLSGMDVKEGE